MKFDDALDYIRNPYVTEGIYEKEQRILHIELNSDPESVTLEKAKEFFECSKLLNLVTIASGDDRVSNIADDALSAFDLAFTTSSTQCEALIQVSDVDEAISGIEASVISNPQSSIMLVQLLRQRAYLDVATGLVSESTVYATLQGGPEFQTWISERDALPQDNSSTSTILSNRDGSVLTISLNRPDKANAFSVAMRDELVEQLRFAAADRSIQQVILKGKGNSFCSGGDLSEFGLQKSTSEAHLIRMVSNPAFWMSEIQDRMSVHLKGNCIGAGIELPAFSNNVIADETISISLPEIQMGLIPGSGGTVSIPRRVGPQKMVYLALSGESIDSQTALDWKLIDKVVSSFPTEY